MKSLSAEARKKAGPARSSGEFATLGEALAPADPVRPLEDVAPLVQIRLGEGETGSQRVDPDADGPSSRAIARVKPMTPPLLEM